MDLLLVYRRYISELIKEASVLIKTQRSCNTAVLLDPCSLEFVPDHFKGQEMCDWVVDKEPHSLAFVLDWFVTKKQIGLWHDSKYRDDGKIIKWYNNYKKRKAQKAKIKKELMPIAWHPSGWWDWHIPRDEKKETEKLWK